jgi:hypothetical protein
MPAIDAGHARGDQANRLDVPLGYRSDFAGPAEEFRSEPLLSELRRQLSIDTAIHN